MLGGSHFCLAVECMQVLTVVRSWQEEVVHCNAGSVQLR